MQLFFATCFVVFLLGCGKEDETRKSISTAASAPATVVDASQTLTFDERQWTLKGDVAGRDRGDIDRFEMDAIYYTSDDPTLRLLELNLLPSETGAFRRVRVVQILSNEGWIQHGLREDLGRDGTRTINRIRYGKDDGELRSWWPNGRLQLQKTFVAGKPHGTSSAWRQDGSLAYEDTYDNGKLVSSRRFD